MSSIPASNYVQINPAVIGAGGSALALNGILLTSDTSIPIGTVQPFYTADSVSAWFGPSAIETSMGASYFKADDNKTLTPGLLYLAQYNAAAVAGYLRSGSFASTTLAELQALSGTLTITFAGSALTSATINLSSATSFSNAATLIQAGFTTPPFAVTYDVLRSAYATGTLATGLLLTAATGAVLSQGADAQTPAGMMASIINQTLNWASFTTTFEPVTADKEAFSLWVNSQNNRFAYIGWDTSATGTIVPDTTSWVALIKAAGYSGTIPVYRDYLHAAFFMGFIAALDFNRTNGRKTLAYKYQSGLTASVSNVTTANNLEANGYNYIGNVATANQGFVFAFPGQITGSYKFVDSYVNQVYLNSQFQLALLTLLTSAGFVPYTTAGYTQIRQSCMDPINQMLNYGGIQPGVTLSAAQASEVNTQAGTEIATTLSQRGWYLQIQDASAQVRGVRGSPPMTFWYMDGGSVQRINLASIVVL
ncbi:MAG: hypothetical protein B7Y46_16645 [Acidovorax sp. 28-64-14]|uniref:DUF3383 domain-containing protein n=1 Tax=Acidovorax sp. 28-64-14 TaxID=1970310 RepID=UPI000BD52D97|nr:DUF3383 domain-containing protein [Acidovorax sp. 28-64-14]OYY83019.1 MAG: hypothetical protein B7Y46_16645 [Acidovorax sp. 28-64-14]